MTDYFYEVIIQTLIASRKKTAIFRVKLHTVVERLSILHITRRDEMRLMPVRVISFDDAPTATWDSDRGVYRIHCQRQDYCVSYLPNIPSPLYTTMLQASYKAGGG